MAIRHLTPSQGTHNHVQHAGRGPRHTGPDPAGPDSEEVILGVDTHKDIHVAAVVTTLGAQLADATFPTTTAGYRQLLAWARSFGVLARAGVEGTGSYGAPLTRYLRRNGLTVIEVNRPDRAARRHGKTDTGRRRRRGPRRAVPTRHHHREDRRRAGGDAAPVPPGPRLRGQGPHPGDQPAQRRHRHRRPAAARDPDRPD